MTCAFKLFGKRNSHTVIEALLDDWIKRLEMNVNSRVLRAQKSWPESNKDALSFFLSYFTYSIYFLFINFFIHSACFSKSSRDVNCV